MTQFSNYTKNAHALVVVSISLISLTISGCSGVVSSSAEAAVQSSVLVELAPPTTPAPTTLPPVTTLAPTTTLPPLQPIVVAVAPLDVPLVAIGKTDGQQGIASSKFRSYQKECAKHGLSSDFNAYQQGHAEGVLLYCTYDAGRELGQSGGAYNKVCTGALEPQFRLGYDRGRKWYQAESALLNLQKTLQQNAGHLQQTRRCRTPLLCHPHVGSYSLKLLL